MKQLVVVAVALIAMSCSASRPGPGVRNDRTLLSIEELSKSGAHDAFTAVSALRPHWLSTRGTASIRNPESVKVYLDGNLMGGPDQLRQIMVSSIGAIRHMDALEATQRYGLDHGSGAILLFTRRHEQERKNTLRLKGGGAIRPLFLRPCDLPPAASSIPRKHK